MMTRIRALAAVLATTLLFPQAASAFVLGGYHWEPAQVDFNIDLSHNGATSPSGTSWNNAFVEAVDAWNDVTNLSFTASTATADSCTDLTANPLEANAAVFRSDYCGTPWEPAVLAVTVTWYDTNTNVAVESDMMFNALESWDIYHGAWGNTVADFRRVAVHELGHTLGLNHETINPAIMMPQIAPGSTVETPTADDISGAAALYGEVDNPNPIDPTPDPIIQLALEEPAVGSVKSGIANLRGWVVTKLGLNRVELYIDGKLVGNVPSGGPRGDVANAFPDYPDSERSGFSMIRNYSNLSSGEHTARVVAYDQLGRSVETSATFNVVRFDNAFISNPALVSLSAAQVDFDSDSFYVQGVSADGKLYDLTLRWSTATQGYQIISITPN